MLMDSEPHPSLPKYEVRSTCHECGRHEIHRVEIDHPIRGRILACGICAGLIRAGFK